MQFAKDSFYIALRDRLAALNPDRTIVIEGRMRPAVLVAENEPEGAPHLPGIGSCGSLPNAFYISWGAPQFVKDTETATRPLMKMDCAIAYRAAASQPAAVDRGRALAALDSELLRLLAPPRTPKRDHAHTPPVDLGSALFWSLAALAEAEAEGDELRRSARVTIFFFPEVDQA